MRSSIINEFVTDFFTRSQTDWVITMPTKRDNIIAGSGILPNRPFSNNFANETATGSCDAYTLRIFNREEATLGAAPGVLIGLRPPPAAVPGQVLCWQANVVEFGPTGLLGSTNNDTLPGAARVFASIGATSTGAVGATFSRRTVQGPNGWAALDFGATNTATAGQGAQSITPLRATLNGVAFVGGTGTHFGLPVIGAMFHNYTNASVSSAYGGVIPHRYVRTIDTLDRGTP